MTNVLEFPASRIRGGSVSLTAMTDTLDLVTGGTAPWFNSDAQKCAIMDRGGMAVLLLEKYLADAIRLSLRFWNDDTSEFEEDFCCYLLLRRSRNRRVLRHIDDLRASEGASAKLELRNQVADVLTTAAERLEAGAVVRVIS